MGDSRRFNEFAKRIARNLKHDVEIADVAGGKGYLRLALADYGLKNVETWDKRHKRISGRQRYSYFDYKSAPETFGAVVGMHPDEGTDHIISYAAKYRVPAFVCPCCVKPSAHAFWGANKYNQWLKHLIKIGETGRMEVVHTAMPFNGRNDFLMFRPK